MSDASAGDRPVRIAAVPAQHPYVQGVLGSGCVLLPDPPVPGAPAHQWWPPQVLSADWLRAHATEYDLVHVHFGTESLSLDRLQAALAALRGLGKPLVHTVHDLEHPHLVEQGAHRAHLDLLVAEAAVLLTLTDRAAAELARRYGREATVVPHPQMAPDAWFARADGLRAASGSRGAPSRSPGATGGSRGGQRAAERRGGGGPGDAADPPPRGPVVGVHLRSLRANVRPGRWLGRLATEVAARDGRLLVLVNDDVRAGTAADEALRAVLATLPDAGVEVVVRPRPDDDGLARELVGLDVSVLPYAHGTHSGWLELCWDLGVPVLSPAVGAIADQHREPWALATFDAGRPDAGRPDAVGGALDRLLAGGPVPDGAERLAERRRVAEVNRQAHAAAYRRALASADPGRAAGAR